MQTAARPNPKRYLFVTYCFITKTPLILFLNHVALTRRCLLCRLEHGIALNVYPICHLCRDMTAEAVLLVVSSNLLVGCIRLVESPSPSIAPQRIAWVASFFVFDHDEPHLRPFGPMHVTSRHLTVISCEYFFDQHSSVRELSILKVVLSRSRRRVGVMQIDVAIQISD